MGRRKKTGQNIHGILLLNKATGHSSNAELQRVRRLLDANKAGHTGTLDPLATGMLPICFGEATKLSPYLLTADKAYVTVARLGVTTDTGDAEGTITSTEALKTIERSTIEQVVRQFKGEIWQVPPMYSAVKHQGQRLYKLAREGKSVARKPRQVTIHKIEVIDFKESFLTLMAVCSKGTYIRTLVEDIGASLGCGAHVHTLHRQWVSPFTETKMVSIGEIEASLAAGSLCSEILLPMDYPLAHLKRVELSEAAGSGFCVGQAVSLPSGTGEAATLSPLDESTPIRVYSEGKLLGLGSLVDDRIQPNRVFNFD